MSTNHSKVVVNMKAICLPHKNQSSFWTSCSSRLTFFLNWEFWMILFRADAIFASSISKYGNSFRKLIARTSFLPIPQPSQLLWSITQLPTENQNNLRPVFWILFSTPIGEPVELQFRHFLSLLSDHVVLRSIHRIFRTRSQRSCRKYGHWNCAIILSVFTCQTCFYSCLEFQRNCFSISSHVVRWNSLRKISTWIKRRQIDLQKRSPVLQIDSMYQTATFCPGWATNENLESSQVDWKRETIFHKNFIQHPGILQNC